MNEKKGMVNDMNKKKIISLGMTVILAFSILSGCGKDTQNAGSSENVKQAMLGGLTFLYDDTIWVPNPDEATDTSLRFAADNNGVFGASCAKEDYYQHPLGMVLVAQQLYDTYDNFVELQEPELVEVNGQKWYEWVVQYDESGVTVKSIHRYFAENYYAYTLSYLADASGFDANKEAALEVMDSAKVVVPDNREAEDKAKEFLVGEWDLGASGYLVIAEDGNYTWYMDGTKDAANMHTGTYGCDVENAAFGFVEGEGIYLVLFPEKLVADGVESMTGSLKYDYGIAMVPTEDGAYQMINPTTLAIYEMKKQ